MAEGETRRPTSPGPPSGPVRRQRGPLSSGRCPVSPAGTEVLGLGCGRGGTVTANKRLKRLVRERARRTGESYVSARRTLLQARSKEDGLMSKTDGAPLVELVLEGVEVADDAGGLPYLDLREKHGSRRLPVFIGAPEAVAIRFALGGGTSARPMTHDALKQMLEALGGRLECIVISLVVEASTYTADVTVTLPDGGERHFDWRVSDAVALAVRSDPRPTMVVPNSILDAPPRTLGAVYTLICSCGAKVRIPAEELTAVADRPGSFRADRPCPSCGERVEVDLPPPPSSKE